jgi:hypothetical protein
MAFFLDYLGLSSPSLAIEHQARSDHACRMILLFMTVPNIQVTLWIGLQEGLQSGPAITSSTLTDPVTSLLDRR